MQTFYEVKPNLVKQSAVALGFFDGVHPGHRVVIDLAVEDARKMGVTPTLVTFADHPRNLTTQSPPKLLTVIEQRLELYAALGIEVALVLTFNEDICRMSPREYVETILVGGLGAKSISVGQNHHFGRNREGDALYLATLGTELGFALNVAPLVQVDGMEVSSSRIREALGVGDVQLAAKLLARPYAVFGTVISGMRKGKQLGFPTANLQTSDRQILPANGVYAGVIKLEDGRALPCVINLGIRPTVSPEPTLSLEAHILDFNEDIYNQKVSLEFWQHLRAEKKFASLEELKEQISKDCLLGRQILAAK